MQGFLPTVIAITVFARIIKLALPDVGNYGKYISFFSGICLAAVMISPLVDVISVLTEGVILDIKLPEYNGTYEDILESEIAEELFPSVEEYVSNELASRFSVEPSEHEISIAFETDSDVIEIKKISIRFYGSARFKNTAEIKKYFEDKLKCLVEISIDIA